jgi:hypothetical protein
MRTTTTHNYLKIPAYTATIVLCATALEPQVFGQGCVQSRGAGIGMLLNGEDTYLQAGQWQATLGYRWLHSDRHFVGAVEQPQRQERGDEVINDSHFFDLTATYAVTKRLSLNLTLPFVYSDRSSKYEHLGNNPPTNPRFHTQAAGLADIRLTSSFWLLDPEKHHDGNFALGVGIKAPTGDAEATDTFQRTSGPTVRYVDQSIQPGDGGWGAIIEAQGFQKLFKDTYAYMQGSYLINPEERNDATGYSTPDSYLVRAGLSYNLWPAKGLSLSLGGRMEGVPAEDWIGSSEGGRRPGYSISIEPGIVWTHKKLAITVTAPVAIERNRERSVSDLRSGGHGDAAFADYIITSSISYRF